jgi:membrane-anchored protein YejM (alkaline phosphatase superfamily)
VNVNKRPGQEFTEAFLNWEEEKSEPWAACINLMDTHMPYVPEERFNKWEGRGSEDLSKNKPDVPALLQEGGWETLDALEDLYDGTIRQADYFVQNLLDRLSDRDEYEETLIIVTSDHGEAFGEQGQVDPEIRLVGHGWGIHEVLTHVPLLVKWPRQQTGTTVTNVTTLTDLPEMMSKTLSSDTMDSFVSDDPILASTFRMPPRVVSKLDHIDEIDRYRGPWRAIYENQKGHIRKYASRRGSHVTVDSYSAQHYEVSDRTHHQKTRGMFGDISYEEVYGKNKRDISEEVEDKLADLGYM